MSKEQQYSRLKQPTIPNKVEVKKEKTELKDKKKVTCYKYKRSDTMPATSPSRYSNIRCDWRMLSSTDAVGQRHAPCRTYA